MRIAWLYSGDDGESHFTDLELPVTPSGRGRGTDFFPAEGVSFQYRSVSEYDYHPAPRRQPLITIAGRMEVQVADGSRRVFGPEDVLLADDTEGHGHITRRTEAGLTVWVSLSKSLDLARWRVP